MIGASRSQTIAFQTQICGLIVFVLTLNCWAADSNSPSLHTRPAWSTSRFSGTPEPPPPYIVEECLGGFAFAAPTFLAQSPDAEHLFVGQLDGKIFAVSLDSDGSDPDLVIDLREHAPADAPCELYDLTFHDNFTSNRFVYVSYLRQPGTPRRVWVSRFEVSEDAVPRILAGSEKRLLSWPGEGHNGGCLRFGTDGYLYISIGDGVSPVPPDRNNVGQDVTSINGTILRIDVNHEENGRNYAIPSDNPFVDMPGARGEIWAIGLRNPWKMDFDRKTGELWVADVGWDMWEMVHLVGRGHNCGWSIMEGRRPLRRDVAIGPAPITPPVKDYPRTEALSITGGIVYHGSKFPELTGYFVHGDYRTGNIWALRAGVGKSYSHQQLTRTTLRIVAFAQDRRGNIYVLDHDNSGKIFRLVYTPTSRQETHFPTRLSETGLYQSLDTLAPSPGVVPYEVTVEQWLDGAKAQRLIALPDQARVTITSRHGRTAWGFPEGTVLARTITYPASPTPIRLETQILHRHHDSWNPYSYLWNNTQDEAELVDPGGANLPIHAAEFSQSIVPHREQWRVLSRTECAICHDSAVGSVLGFVPNQIAREILVNGQSFNQLDTLTSRGVFASRPVFAAADPTRLVNWHDESEPLDARARSYLDANCGICHNESGVPYVMVHLQRHKSFEETRTQNPPILGSFGLLNPLVLSPGDPYSSTLLCRMGKVGFGRMPYFGSQVVDSEAFALIHDWIASLPTPPDSLQGTTEEESIALQITEMLNNGGPKSQLEQAILRQLESPRGTMTLINLIHQGKFTQQQIEFMATQHNTVSDVNVATLLESLIPDSRRRPRLGPNPDPKHILSLAGDESRGRLIFYSESARCLQCHQRDEQGYSLGAELSEIGKKYSKPDLLTQILQPSAKIDPNYIPYVIHMNSGLTHTGMIVEQTDKKLVLKDAQQNIRHLAIEEVEASIQQETSLMPVGIIGDLTAQDAADLLEFLSTLRGP